MMPPIKDLAIVLRSIPYQERHKIITALTENHGVISVLAKNAIQSRRFGSALELFTASEWVFNQKQRMDLYFLSDTQVRKSFEKLAYHFEGFSLASLLNEIILRIIPQRTGFTQDHFQFHTEAYPQLFRLHSNALTALTEIPSDLDFSQIKIHFLNIYLGKLLQWSGNQPQLHSCLNCKTSLEQITPTSQLICLIADAAWVCETCQKTSLRHIQIEYQSSFQSSFLKLSPLLISDFQKSLNIPIRQAIQAKESSQQKELFRFLEALFTYHIPGYDNRALKGLRFLGLESIVSHEEVNHRKNQSAFD